MLNLRDVIIRAWDETEACPDGFEAKFCPSCLYQSVIAVLEALEIAVPDPDLQEQTRLRVIEGGQ